MGKEKRAILALVAAGRISAGEAERLVRAWNEPARWFFAAIVCVVLLLAQAPSPGAHWVHDLARHGMEAWGSTARLLMEGKEGSV